MNKILLHLLDLGWQLAENTNGVHKQLKDGTFLFATIADDVVTMSLNFGDEDIDNSGSFVDIHPGVAQKEIMLVTAKGLEEIGRNPNTDISKRIAIRDGSRKCSTWKNRTDL
jgi:hypothetical protein